VKILYAIQGTGNGHLSRARDIVPVLMKNHFVDLLVSGTQADVELPYKIRYKYRGLGFVFGSNGGIDIRSTYRKNRIRQFLSEIYHLPVKEYDLVINDFEPVSAWACKLRNVPCISVSHQAAVISKHSPKPEVKDILGWAILKQYAPSDARYGFHFREYSKSIYTPVIRSQVRSQKVVNNGHYTVYLPAYDDERILTVLEKFPETIWQVFSKHNRKKYKKGSISIEPISNDAFIHSMVAAEGVLCGAGFETPAEALFLKKKLLVIPMKGQFEQLCNAAALREMGVPVIKSLKPKHADSIQDWIRNGKVVEVNYPERTEEIINGILSIHEQSSPKRQEITERKYSASRFRRMVLDRIAAELFSL
jgi:uncharacterized protein (TIGR00661 family)